MSVPKKPQPAKLIMALLYSQREVLEKLSGKLTEKFGLLEWESPEFVFNHTRYYTEEMGENLKKKLIGFNQLINPENLPEIKLATNLWEQEFSLAGKRRVNIDPGYLTLNSLVLATGKESAHRVYLRSGVYAEVTLVYQSGSFQPLPWSYPDFRLEQVLESLNQIRKKFCKELKSSEKDGGT